MDGLILINKDRDWTSRDVCNVVQKIHGTKKVGHTGTLDPFAEGLLLVTINKANKIGQFLDDFTKTYVATLKLGVKTNTGDLTGEVIETIEIPNIKKEDVEKVIKTFLGDIEQIPPMTSAIHYKGRKLYEYFYEGVEVERPSRKVHIYSINLLDFKDDTIVFEVEVSKGTYIRILGEDIATKLNTVGHLTRLIRTKIGPYDIKNSINLKELTNQFITYTIDETLSFLDTFVVEEKMTKKVKDGLSLTIPNIKGELVYIKSENDEPLAIYKRKENDLFVCKRGIW
ncbi:MAG: tRNA pseudouridine(55) synthase TruB [Bacilli bacterium]|nr:tRNA pseudouridine(55) synthase TruB [Bacilli bacterium]